MTYFHTFAGGQASIAATSAWFFAIGILMALILGGRPAHSQMPMQPFGDQIVVRPANPTTSDSIEIDVPVFTCFLSPPTSVRTSSVSVNGGKIHVAVDQTSSTCWAAGDPRVERPVTLTLDPLPPGAYCIEYVRTMFGALTLHRWLPFVVGAPAVASQDCPSPLPLQETAVEYFHPGFGHYFVTNNADEIAKLDAGRFDGWQRTGLSFGVFTKQENGTRPVCRYFSRGFDPKSSHYYGLRQWTCEGLFGGADWMLEGEPFYMAIPNANGDCPAGMVPVYRLFNMGQGAAPNHRFTIDANARAAMIAAGWIAEGMGVGVGMCGPA